MTSQDEPVMPHEETWKRVGHDVVSNTRGRVLMAVAIAPNDHASLDLAAAAPLMARVLVDILRRIPASDLRFTLGSPLLDDIHAAIDAAGVPLP